MRIGIVGPGAMGTLFGCLLARTDDQATDVWMLCRRAADAARIQERGLLVEQDGESLRAEARATARPLDAAPLDLLIVLVKAFATAEAIAACAPALAPDGVVLTLQNGLDNDRTIAAAVGAERVLAGVTSQGATLLETGRARHAGAGPTILADLTPSGTAEPTPRAQRIAALLSRAGIATQAVADVAPVVWGKLVASSALNPLTALTGRRNGELLTEPSCLGLAEDTARETARVAAAASVSLPFTDPAAHFRSVAQVTAPNRSSMLQDVERRRPTEVGAINEAIVAEARRLGLQAPINETLARLVREREARYLGAPPGTA